MRLKAIQFHQNGTPMYVSTLHLADLEHFSTDKWDPRNALGRRGYQRFPDEKRIQNIAKYFERRKAIMPVAGLLNVREKRKIRFRDGELSIPDGTKIWVVDMQHRLGGLVRAHEHGPTSPP